MKKNFFKKKCPLFRYLLINKYKSIENIKKENYMKKISSWITISSILVSAFFVSYCASGSGDVNNAAEETGFGVIQGKISTSAMEFNTSTASAGNFKLSRDFSQKIQSSISTPSGVTVDVLLQDDSGSESTVSKGSVKTDQNGNFTIAVQAGKSGNYIVVAKDSAGNEASALVDGTVDQNETVIAEPVTDNTTAQVEVLKDLKSGGKFMECFINPQDLKERLPNEVTSHLSGLNLEARKQLVAIMAHGICKARMAKVKALQSLGLSMEEIRNLELALITARRALNKALIEAGDDQVKKDLAFENFARAAFEARKNSTLTPETDTYAEIIATRLHAIFEERFIQSLIATDQLKAGLKETGMIGYRLALLKRTASQRSLAVHRFLGFNYQNPELAISDVSAINAAFKVLIEGMALVPGTGSTANERISSVKTALANLLNTYQNQVITDLSTKSGLDLSAQNSLVTLRSDTLKTNVDILIANSASTPENFTLEHITYFTSAKADLPSEKLSIAKILISLGGNRF
jgi:hypothetical protein